MPSAPQCCSREAGLSSSYSTPKSPGAPNADDGDWRLLVPSTETGLLTPYVDPYVPVRVDASAAWSAGDEVSGGGAVEVGDLLEGSEAEVGVVAEEVAESAGGGEVSHSGEVGELGDPEWAEGVEE